MKNRVEIKREAKALALSGKTSPLLIGAVVVAVQFALDRISSLVSRTGATVDEIMAAVERNDLEALMALDPMPDTAGTFVTILSSLVIVVLMGGFYAYCMGIREGCVMPPATLLDGLGIAGKLIWCDILMGIKIALWSMLFVIPGIVAAYRYRFAMYNIVTDPTISASEAIARSCRQTEGMKLDLFVLDLSFLGWNLLTGITYGLLGIFVLPYATLSDLGYFDEARLRSGDPIHQPPKNDTPWEF